MTSNGQLLAMGVERRRKAIAAMQPVLRERLAHIASLGALRYLDRAAELSGLIADLTAEQKASDASDS